MKKRKNNTTDLKLFPPILFTILLTLGGSLLQGACQYTGTRTIVSLELPEIPQAWKSFAGDFGYVIIYPGTIGRAGISFSPGEKGVLDLPKGETVPVLAYPVPSNPEYARHFEVFQDLLSQEGMGIISVEVLAEGAGFSPAGGLLPYTLTSEKGEDTLVCTWENGFASAVLFSQETAGLPLEQFNARRFLQEAAKRGEGNPWGLKKERVAEMFATGEFRVYGIRLGELWEFCLPLAELFSGGVPPPGLGEWVGGNLLDGDARLLVDPEDGLCIAGAVYPGRRHFYHRETGERMVVDCTEEEWSVTFPLRGAGLFGKR